ncbi:hypothetical protein PTTG_01410 [Puccinia triticina 1-1 BBBD Race 1]|uniref:MCM N-terminal domain-containing protein n=1 Tax=Puccinia triticina (isolate 1-1 / race 1 (BBBD)) TaxID=630390 RepID=A0A180G9C8_PUCT1|nr:hypothetical protein PTTG_01410 [Puccinia triticina 1-1 BBBD Race 1]
MHIPGSSLFQCVSSSRRVWPTRDACGGGLRELSSLRRSATKKSSLNWNQPSPHRQHIRAVMRHPDQAHASKKSDDQHRLANLKSSSPLRFPPQTQPSLVEGPAVRTPRANPCSFHHLQMNSTSILPIEPTKRHPLYRPPALVPIRTSEAAPHPTSSQAAPPEPGTQTAIGATLVPLQDSMQTFRQYMQGFKKTYRLAFDLTISVEDASTLSDGDQLLYANYMRKMRLTSQINLNSD